jgi:dipeptidase D
VVDFGKSLGLETFEDEIHNVIIRKPASPGMENRKAIILQSHLDMVHQKNADTVFDFNTQGIDMTIDGEWVRAKGTTLGADNGIGVATIMAILKSKEIEHPAIEALFTIDEETGMTGALGLKGGILKGKILLNLDTEQDDEIDIGCAGGVDVTATRKYESEEKPVDCVGYSISVKGLNGGHSGMDIHKGLGNANKIMARLLFKSYEKFGLRIAMIDGGSLRNAIPRECNANVLIDKNSREIFKSEIEKKINEIKEELKTIEPKLTILVQSAEIASQVMKAQSQSEIINSLYAASNGVYRMSADIPDLVETSNNIARVIVKDGEISVGCLTRSSIESSKYDLADALKATFELGGCTVVNSGAYPGWTPDVKSEILKLLVDIYQKQNGNKPKVVACHAGLECGILGTNYPGMEMISFGPTILGAHSPDERANIPSVQKFWKYILEILKEIPMA